MPAVLMHQILSSANSWFLCGTFLEVTISICFRLMLIQQSLQKNSAILLQGLLLLYKKAVFELTIEILA